MEVGGFERVGPRGWTVNTGHNSRASSRTFSPGAERSLHLSVRQIKDQEHHNPAGPLRNSRETTHTHGQTKIMVCRTRWALYGFPTVTLLDDVYCNVIYLTAPLSAGELNPAGS